MLNSCPTHRKLQSRLTKLDDRLKICSGKTLCLELLVSAPPILWLAVPSFLYCHVICHTFLRTCGSICESVVTWLRNILTWVQRAILRNMSLNSDIMMGRGMEGEWVCMFTNVSYPILSSIINTWYTFLSHSTYSYGGGKTWYLDSNIIGSFEVFMYQCFWSFLWINRNIMEEYSITDYSTRSKFYDTLIINKKCSKSQLTYIGGNFTTPSTMSPTKSFIIGEQ